MNARLQKIDFEIALKGEELTNFMECGWALYFRRRECTVFYIYAYVEFSFQVSTSALYWEWIQAQIKVRFFFA